MTRSKKIFLGISAVFGLSALAVGVWYALAVKPQAAFLEESEHFRFERREILADGAVRYHAPVFSVPSADKKATQTSQALLKTLTVHRVEVSPELPVPKRLHLSFEMDNPIKGLMLNVDSHTGSIFGEVDYSYNKRVITLQQVALSVPGLAALRLQGQLNNLDLSGFNKNAAALQQNQLAHLFSLGQAQIHSLSLTLEDRGLTALLRSLPGGLEDSSALAQALLQELPGLNTQQQAQVEQAITHLTAGNTGVRVTVAPASPLPLVMFVLNQSTTLGDYWQRLNLSIELL